MSQPKSRSRFSITVLKWGMLLLCLIIFGRLFQLQILQYDRYNPQSRKNALRQQMISPARGLIYDRNGQLIVDNEPIYSINITPARYDTSTTPLLAEILHLPVDSLRSRIQQARQYSMHRASRIIAEVNLATFSAIEENIWRLPGISHQVESKRHYPIDSLRASHLLGYLREVSQEEYQQSDRYMLGDKAGKSGIEASFNAQLWGEHGTNYTLVNAMGQALGPYNDGENNIPPKKGYNLHTTLDANLQQLAEKLMQGKRGAVVALDPKTGGILSMVSAPQYDIRKLSGRIDGAYWDSLNTDPSDPLFNRAVLSQQPPGSTFKPLMALMGLDMNLITPQTTVYNPGYYYRGRRYGDHADKGTYDLAGAIEKSSNTYFFWLMDKIASGGQLNHWHDLAADFGLGVKSGIDLPYEAPGILPDSAYFNKKLGKNRWGLGDVLNLGIGQGFLSASPLQMAVMTAQIANGGYKITPHIVENIEGSSGIAESYSPSSSKISWIDDDEISVVKNAMQRVVDDGSSRYFTHLDSVTVGGKTGTAQNPHGEDHGWFIAFAPVDDPQIAVAVLLENSGFGSISAAPLASLLIEQYVTGRLNRRYVYDYVMDFEPKITGSSE